MPNFSPVLLQYLPVLLHTIRSQVVTAGHLDTHHAVAIQKHINTPYSNIHSECRIQPLFYNARRCLVVHCWLALLGLIMQHNSDEVQLSNNNQPIPFPPPTTTFPVWIACYGAEMNMCDCIHKPRKYNRPCQVEVHYHSTVGHCSLLGRYVADNLVKIGMLWFR